LVLDGVPYLGARGATGTMASSPIAVPCERCAHMQSRSLEQLAAGPGLVDRFRATGGDAATARDVLALANAGNAPAIHIVQSATEALGSQLGLLVNTLDPEAVLIGGGLGLSEGLYWEHLPAATRRHIW